MRLIPIFAAGALCVASAWAQDPKTAVAVDQAKVEAPAKAVEAAPAQTPAPQAAAQMPAAPAQAAVPAPAPVPAPAAAPAPVAAPAVAPAPAAAIVEPAKPVEPPAKKETPAPAAAPVAAPAKLTGCADCVKPLVEGYKGILTDLEKWIAEVNTQTAAAEETVQKLNQQIKENEAAITKLKLEDGKDAKNRAKELSRENKRLWGELEAARKAKAALCKQFSREASQKVRQYNTDISENLKAVQAQMQQQ